MEPLNPLEKVENSAVQVNEMVDTILGESLVEIDTYLDKAREIFNKGDEILSQDLDRMILQIPVYIYNLIVLAQQIEMKKGIAKEHAKYAENEALLNATGTVAEKQAKAELATVSDRITQTAYLTASSIVTRKIDGAMAILDSCKKVVQRRTAELKLTAQAGSAVGF